MRRPITALCIGLAALAGASVLLGSFRGVAASQADKRKPGLYWTMQTDKGNISCKLDEAQSPIAVRTMVGLAIGKLSYIDPENNQTERKKYFDGQLFYRVIPGVLIQSGDPTNTGSGHPGGPGFPYKSEIDPSLKFDKPGQLAMAKAGTDLNDTHFFITLAANPSFDGHYTIWGQCQNLDVAKAIANVPHDEGETPTTPVHIQHVIVERVGPAPADAPEAAAQAPSN